MIIEELRNLNNKLINKNHNNEKELKKQLLIKELLKDNHCFLKINIETAYAILKDLHIPSDKIKLVYLKLI